MSWGDDTRRRAAIRSALAFAQQHPAAGLPYDRLPEVRSQFADRRDLLLALQHDWSEALWARIERLSLDVRLADARELGRTAWQQCAEQHPVLRRLLDDHREEFARCA